MTPPLSTPNERRRLTRALMIGVGLAIVGVVLFLVIYVAMSGASSVARLFTALCVPPAVLALIVGVYFLVARSRQA